MDQIKSGTNNITLNEIGVRFPLVLQKVLENLSCPTLQCCRLVCTVWNNEACRILESRCTVSFQSCKDLRKYCDTVGNSNTNVSIQLQSFSFSRSLFNEAVDWCGVGGMKKLEYELHRLSMFCGESVSKLEIIFNDSNCDIDNSSLVGFRKFMSNQLNYLIYRGFPNVKNLRLFLLFGTVVEAETEECVEDRDGDAEGVGDLPDLEDVTLDIYCNEVDLTAHRVNNSFIKNLLNSAPNLRAIRSTTTTGAISSSWIVLRESFRSSIPVISDSLSYLRLNFALVEEDMNALTSCEFPNLDNVQFEIDTSSVSDEALNRFLFQHKNNLKCLHMQFQATRDHAINKYDEFPPFDVIMTELVKLSLQAYNGQVVLDRMPKLKELEIDGMLTEIHTPCTGHSSIQKFNVIANSHWISHCGTALSDNWVWNLTSLEMVGLNLAPYSVIFRECKNLKNLSIKSCRGLDDEAVCGMKMSLVSRFSNLESLKLNSNSNEIAGVISSAKRAFRMAPFIGDLKELRTLTIHGNISDNTILYGIVSCGKLKRLEIKSDSSILTYRAQLIIMHELPDLLHCELS